MVIDENAIDNAIKGIRKLCDEVLEELKSGDEYRKQMGYNIACYLKEFVEFNGKMMGLYIKTGLSLATDANVNYSGTNDIKPHPIYVWDEEDEQEREPKKKKMPDALKRILKEILEDE
jgi:hypothetical protein